MKIHSDQTLRERTATLIEYQKESTKRNNWTWFVDKIYSPDCVYTCEYAGTMLVRSIGIEEICSTHYGRDMQLGWQGWEFPYLDIYVGTENRVITHWLNRGPGRRPDGSYYQTPGISLITWDENLMISEQLDLFDLAHQMRLCDELESAGLLSPELKKEWVIPCKKRLTEMLNS